MWVGAATDDHLQQSELLIRSANCESAYKNDVV